MPHAFTPEEWSRIEAILDEVMDLDAEVRTAVLDRACAGDAVLRAQVERLIAADTDADQFLETPAMVYAAGLVDAASSQIQSEEREKPGDRIGPYSVIREIGHGGMGRVFLADRADGQFEQLVALKLVRSGQFGSEILGRFLRERQILARLQHPNIARLLDGGVTADGRPYFAMEYVEGEPITTYCDGRGARRQSNGWRSLPWSATRSSTRTRTSSSIATSSRRTRWSRSEGQVKLLDFGIAKVLHEEHEEPGGGAGVDTPRQRTDDARVRRPRAGSG